jgi:GNAT superfamily N-acetyltransferase
LTALLALSDVGPAGFVSLPVGHALYTGRALATMQEFYVGRPCRSRAIGMALIGEVERLARQSGWRRIEVCTPPLPAVDATLAFYQRHGFDIAGGRKLKKLMAAGFSDT